MTPPSQVSVAAAVPGLIVAEHCPGRLGTLMSVGQVIVGGVLSVTVKVVVQVLELFAASVAVTVIVVVPIPTSVPADGVCDKVIEPGE